MLQNFIPRSASERHDGRISLEFQAFAAGHDEFSAELAEGETQLRDWLAALVAQATGVEPVVAATRATALLGTAEGLGLKVLSAGLDTEEALSALHAQLQLNGLD